MPQNPVAPAEPREASVEDIISAYANEYGVNPALAIAVATRESRNPKTGKLDPNAVSPKGAKGYFQLMPAAAQDMGVNRDDPLGNIEGGVKYLKLLDQRFGGDVQKILQGYNGGPEHVDNGTVSADAQAYAADILASLSGGKPEAPRALAPSAGTAAPSSMEQAPGYLESARRYIAPFLAPFDPRTSEGQVNLASTAGAAAATALTGGTASAVPWLIRVFGPALGAAIAGGSTAAIQKSVGTADANPYVVGAEQAGYELGGQAFVWPIRTIAKDFMAGSVGRQAREALQTSYKTLRTQGRDAMDALRATLKSGVEAVADTGARKVEASVRMGEAAKRLAKDTSAARLADIEVENAAKVKAITDQYDALHGAAPSTGQAAALARRVVGGMPGLVHDPTGPAKRALDIAGERVANAAQNGPDLEVASVKEAAQRMAADTLPTSMLARRAAAEAPHLKPRMGDESMAIGKGKVSFSELPPATKEALVKQGILPESALLPPDHPLPKLLGEFQQEADTIPFAEAHKWKMLFDSAVNWDERSKDLVLRMTKGVRTELRRVMAGYEPYNTATQAYAKLIPLYEEGIGRDVIVAAAKDPDKVARLLDVKEPASAVMLRQLLVDQSRAGGDEILGRQAWDAIRARFTYDKIIHGGVETLGQRLETLATENPEFFREVYGDTAGAQVLSNLQQIGKAYQEAVAQGEARVKMAKAIGAASVEDAGLVASHATSQVRREAATDLRAARAQATAERQAIGRKITAGKEAVAEKIENLKESSVGPYVSRRANENVAVDVARGIALGPSSKWGALSILRLLKGPRSDELLEWAAYSQPNTRRLVSAILSPVNERAAGALIRDAFGAIGTELTKPVPSPEAQ